MLNEKEIKQIKELRSKGWSVSKIARELKLSRPTILKYLDHYDLSSDREPSIECMDEEFQPDEITTPAQQRGKPAGPLQHLSTDGEMTRLKLKDAKMQKTLSALKQKEKELLNDLLCDLLLLKNSSLEMIMPKNLTDLLMSCPGGGEVEEKTNRTLGLIHLKLKWHYETISDLIAHDISAGDRRQRLVEMYESLDALKSQWRRLTSCNDEQSNDQKELKNEQPNDQKELKIFERIIENIRKLLKMI